MREVPYSRTSVAGKRREGPIQFRKGTVRASDDAMLLCVDDNIARTAEFSNLGASPIYALCPRHPNGIDLLNRHFTRAIKGLPCHTRRDSVLAEVARLLHSTDPVEETKFRSQKHLECVPQGRSSLK